MKIWTMNKKTRLNKRKNSHRKFLDKSWEAKWLKELVLFAKNGNTSRKYGRQLLLQWSWSPPDGGTDQTDCILKLLKKRTWELIRHVFPNWNMSTQKTVIFVSSDVLKSRGFECFDLMERLCKSYPALPLKTGYCVSVEQKQQDSGKRNQSSE